MDRDDIITRVCGSECFKTEAACLDRGGFPIAERPGLFKLLENEKVRLIFPTTVREISEGVIVGLVCLFDLSREVNTYAHPIFAGPNVNAALKSLFVPETQAKPQPGVAGHKAIQQFVAWKQAGWVKFLNDELEMGTQEASAIWIRNFWKALDRMYGGGNLLGAT